MNSHSDRETTYDMPLRPWQLQPAQHPDPDLVHEVGGSPLVARLLAQRGVATAQQARAFLDPAHYQPASPSSMPGVDAAAAVLDAALRRRKRLLVWGDFDVDGQTSTALLVEMLRRYTTADHVRYHIPERTDGHGIQVATLRRLLDEQPFEVLLSCDTGIAEAEAVTFARRAGLTVVITDHHDLPDEYRDLRPGIDPLWGLPPAQAPHGGVRLADAVVNPHFCPAGHPLRTLPGVGVAFVVAQQLATLRSQAGAVDDLLELVALGIVADVASQVDDARYFLQRGLQQLRQTQRPGLLALMEFAGLSPQGASAETIGFQIGPRLNSVGRLENADLAVELLTTTNPVRARTLAARVDRVNQERRVLTREALSLAMESIDHQPHLLDANILFLQHAGWHAGVLGLVAGRLAEEFHKPAVVILAPPGQVARGSARSTPGVHIGDALAACSGLLLGHGGHAGAAGFSLLPEKLESLRRALDHQIELQRRDGAKDDEALLIDAELDLASVTLELCDDLNRLAPFGQGNPAPVFMSTTLTIGDDRRLGKEGEHRRLSLQDATGAHADMIWFSGADAEVPVGALDAAYTLAVNEYKGVRTVQLRHVALRPSTTLAESAADRLRRVVTIHDLRREASALDSTPVDALWYAEGMEFAPGGRPAYATRHALAARTSGALVLWSTPPSPAVLDWILQTAAPHTLYLVAQAAAVDDEEGVVRAVLSMCSYALNHGLPADIARMAARIGTTEEVVRVALLLLDAGGSIRLAEWLQGDQVALHAPPPAAGARPEARAAARERIADLRALLAEVRAYRRFLQTARLDQLGLEQTPTPP